MILAAILDLFSIFEILSKTERYYKKWIGNIILWDRNAKYWKKMKSNNYFSIFRKKSTKVLLKSNFRDFLWWHHQWWRHLINVRICINYQGTVVAKLLAIGQGVKFWGQKREVRSTSPLKLLGLCGNVGLSEITTSNFILRSLKLNEASMTSCRHYRVSL